MREFYENNRDFRDYVDTYSRVRCIPVEVAFTHELIKNVYRYYKSKEVN